eukprot:1159839-Pelagomonas_calceolata.AAC.12
MGACWWRGTLVPRIIYFKQEQAGRPAKGRRVTIQGQANILPKGPHNILLRECVPKKNGCHIAQLS